MNELEKLTSISTSINEQNKDLIEKVAFYRQELESITAFIKLYTSILTLILATLTFLGVRSVFELYSNVKVTSKDIATGVFNDHFTKGFDEKLSREVSSKLKQITDHYEKDALVTTVVNRLRNNDEFRDYVQTLISAESGEFDNDELTQEENLFTN